VIVATGVTVAATDDAPDTVTLRVARVVYLMALGRWFTTRQVAELTGLTENGAWGMLDRLAASEHVPLRCVSGPHNRLVWGIGEVSAQDLPW
jgi:alkylated DNA nucleotide flippase Atl1